MGAPVRSFVNVLSNEPGNDVVSSLDTEELYV
jgi:hypothetical protein